MSKDQKTPLFKNIGLSSSKTRSVGLSTAQILTVAAGATAVAVSTATAVWLLRNTLTAMGARSTGRRAEKVGQSTQYSQGAFRNTTPVTTFPPGSRREILHEMWRNRNRRKPTNSIPVETPILPNHQKTTSRENHTAGTVHVTWYGHSSSLIDWGGKRILVDPVWGTRCSPVPLVGPRRLHPPPIRLELLPRLDAIVVSHDHYDHLDMGTIQTLARIHTAPFIVPLGVGAHLERWHIPGERIIELDWHESATIAGIRLTSTPARHFSGRAFSRDQTLWSSWVMEDDNQRRVFYSGDSGYSDEFAAIGATYGPFDATLIQIGAYSPAWPDIHMTPEDGIRTHLDVRGNLFIPVHWATFNLAPHRWAEPADRVWSEAKARGVPLAIPRPGERINIDAPPSVDGWWQTVA